MNSNIIRQTASGNCGIRKKSFSELLKFNAALLTFALCLLPFDFSLAQSRIAILDFQGESAASNHLRKLVQQSAFTLVEPQQLSLALKGSGYHDSLNMTLYEARGLGLSIGCDYYLLGMAKTLRRLSEEKKFYFDVMIAAFLVETRSGKLLRFSFEKAQVAQEATTPKRLAELAETIWQQSTDAIKSAAAQSTMQSPQVEVYDLSTEEATKLGIKPPQFYRRLKPAYTEMADFAGITATIELKVIFQSDGRVGEAEVIRWGGFGLEESAIATVQQLRFEPAKSNGHTVNVSAIVQYNFRHEEKAK